MKPAHFRACALVCVCVAFGNSSTPGHADERRNPGDIVLEKATLAIREGMQSEFEYGTLYVPENRNERKSRLIGVGFARFKAAGATTAPPIFMLPGGPGNSLLAGLRSGSPRLAEMENLRRNADVVLVDQRGFSTRGDVLRHEFRTPDWPLDKPARIADWSAGFADLAKSAVAEFARKNIDLRGYTVLECADDVRDLATSLHYSKIALMGGSFGSQWSFAIMRRHPDIVARALLTGVEPLDCGYDMPSHVLAAVRRIWYEAEKDERFKPYLPRGGLWTAARTVLQRLEQKPVVVTLKGTKDSKTGAPIHVTLGHEDFQRSAFLQGADSPAFVLAIYHEHYDAWASSTVFARRARTAQAPLIGPLIDTSLGVTPKRLHLLRTDPANEFLGQWNFDSYLATADIWPTADVGDDFRTEVVTPIPVVFVNGDWDTQTPIENTLAIAPYFPKSHTVIVEHGGHGAFNQLAQHLPATRDALYEFLRTGSMDKLPTRVSVPPFKFTVPSFPAPKK